MFLVELKNFFLIVGYDFDKMELFLKIELVNGSEYFYGIGGKEYILIKDDLFLLDNIGILFSIFNGFDNWIVIIKDIKNIMYFVYGFDKILEK